MKILIALLISFIAGMSTVLGGFFIYLKPKNKDNIIGGALAFSGTIMMLISIVELIPEGFIYLDYTYGLIFAFTSLVLSFILGNFISSKLSKNLEKLKTKEGSLYKVGILSMIVLMIHNLPEGIITFISSVIDIKLGIKLGISIMMHNIPEGIAIAVPLYYATRSKKKAFKATFISGLSEPLGAILAWIFLSKLLNNTVISLILLFASSLMINIAVNDILLESNNYSRKGVLTGIILAIILFSINFIIFI